MNSECIDKVMRPCHKPKGAGQDSEQENWNMKALIGYRFRERLYQETSGGQGSDPKVRDSMQPASCGLPVDSKNRCFLSGLAWTRLFKEARLTRDLVVKAQKEGEGLWVELTILLVVGDSGRIIISVSGKEELTVVWVLCKIIRTKTM